MLCDGIVLESVAVGMTFSGQAALVGIILVVILASTAANGGDSESTEEWQRRLELLRSVPYIDFSEEVLEETAAGVVFHDPARAYQGYNLYCTRSSGEVFLLDMDGQEVHRWTYPQKRYSAGSDHAVMLDNGDLMVVKKHEELLRLSWDSQVIWKLKLAAHHDVAPAPDGSFYVIARKNKAHRGMRVWFDVIVHVTADGQELDRWFTFDHLAELKEALDPRSFLDTALDDAFAGRLESGPEAAKIKSDVARGRYDFDYFHINTVSVLPATPLGETDPRFRQGNLLICLRNVNQIAVLDGDSYKVLWAWGEGVLEWPHHPTILENGHLLIFDNGVRRRYSQVVEMDPVAGAVVWKYATDPPEAFYSRSRGSSQRLANGNTLISESDRGRVFEVTPDGQVVWIWLNPAVVGTGEEKRRETVYRMIRLLPDQVARLLMGWWWWK